MIGDLTKDCLPDILRRIYIERRSGSLRLVHEHIRKEIFFELGAMIFAASNRREDRIGESMMRHGTITKEQFDQVQAHMGRGKRFGKLLIDMNIITEQALLTNVTFQILDIIYSLFNWTAGKYEFMEIEKSISDDLKLELSTASIILEGVRRISDFDTIERGLGDLNRLIGPATNPLLRLQSLSLKPLERQTIEIIKEPSSLIKLLVNIKSPAESVLRALYGLLSAGVLEHFAPSEVSASSGKLVVPENVRRTLTGSEVIPVVIARTGAHRIDEMALRRRIDMMKTRINENNPYKLLGLTTKSSIEDLHAAYYKLAREFHPDRHLTATKEARAEIEEIFTCITNSYEALRETLQPKPQTLESPAIDTSSAPQIIESSVSVEDTPTRRARQTVIQPMPAFFDEALINSLTANPDEPVALAEAPTALAEIPSTLENISAAPPSKKLPPMIVMPAGSEQLSAQEALADILASLEDAEPGETLPMISERSTSNNANVESPAANLIAQPSTNPIIDTQTDIIPEPGKETSQIPEPIAEPSPEYDVLATKMLEENRYILDALEANLQTSEPVTPIEAVNAQPNLPETAVSTQEKRAEDLFIEGRNRFQNKDLAGSVRALREAVELQPQEVRYRLLLGHILHLNQRWQKEAEEQFNAVLKIDQHNAMAHIGLAQIFIKVGRVEAAEIEYKAALKTEPRNPVALKGLDSLKEAQPKRGGGLLSKLFGKKQ